MRRIQIIFFCFILGANAKFARLTNNQLARENEFPYQVSLQIRGEHTCGGTLISKRHVLTAAHCVDDIDLGSESVSDPESRFPLGFVPNFEFGFGQPKHPMSSLKVSVGSKNMHSGTKLDVDRIAIHPSYDPVSVDNDVAVITLRKPIRESAKVKPIGLPKQNEAISNQANLVMSGFGSRMMGGSTSPALKKLKMHKISPSKCQQDWPTLTSRQICAKAQGHGICVGDSGGPLTVGKELIVGIASAVSPSGCGTNVADLFTRVSAHVNFIKAEMSKPVTKSNGNKNYPSLSWPYNNIYPSVAWPSNNVYPSYYLVYG